MHKIHVCNFADSTDVDDKTVVSETCLDSNEERAKLSIKKKAVLKRSQPKVCEQVSTDDTEEDVIPSSQSKFLKTSRWHREKMKKVGIPKPKGNLPKI